MTEAEFRKSEQISSCNGCPKQGHNPVEVKGKKVDLPYCIAPEDCSING